MPIKKKLVERVYPDILNMAELRSYLRVSYDTAMQLIITGKIPAKRIGKEWRILRQSVDDYISSADPEPSEKVV